MSASLVDVNVNLSRWPFRRLPQDEPSRLVSKLREHNVRQAWTGSFDAILHRDLAGSNARLARDCHEFGHGILVPFGTVNPMFPDWEEDLRRCDEHHHMAGIRLYPNYHGYKLDEPIFARLLHAAAQRDLIVQLAVIMEDSRTQHPLVQVPAVDLAPLPSLANQIEKLRLTLLNSFQPLNLELISRLAATGKVYFDIATLEGVGGIENLLKQIPLKLLLFGSNAPLFYFESSALKLIESALPAEEKRFITGENARRLMAK